MFKLPINILEKNNNGIKFSFTFKKRVNCGRRGCCASLNEGEDNAIFSLPSVICDINTESNQAYLNISTSQIIIFILYVVVLIGNFVLFSWLSLVIGDIVAFIAAFFSIITMSFCSKYFFKWLIVFGIIKKFEVVCD